MEPDLIHIENQLQKRLKYAYHWEQKQNDQWDNYTNFIYNTPDWETLIKKMKRLIKAENLDKRQVFNYAANRWYNFWSAYAVEKIFTQIDGINPMLNKKNKLVDFNCFGINFDHKTSVFPKAYNKSLTYAQKHKKDLIKWLYLNQSREQRRHFKNRLFIVVYNSKQEHWKLKAELTWLKTIIHNYIQDFSKNNLISLTFEENQDTLADIIWAVK